MAWKPMSSSNEVPLILGGHSFFSTMGNDPIPSPAEARKIVNTCLDAGIRMFDTTLSPEKLALGRALEELGRRDEAYLIAWNFMTPLAPADRNEQPTEFRPEHLDQLLTELRTDRIDALVIHDLDNSIPDEYARMETLVVDWQREGHITDLGFWSPDETTLARFDQHNPFSFMVRPLNAYNAAVAAPHFKTSQESLGWKTYACSPFIRGWFLDKMVAEGVASGVSKAKLADLLLRYSLFHPHVDKVITAIRRTEWVKPNVQSVYGGPLSADERSLVETLVKAVQM
jgi:aryl-alcohol dehydrogenase-like predicted oxidoreductase